MAEKQSDLRLPKALLATVHRTRIYTIKTRRLSVVSVMVAAALRCSICLLDTSALSALEVLLRLLRYINLLTYWVTVGVVEVGVVSQPGADAERYRCACLHSTQGLAGRDDG